MLYHVFLLCLIIVVVVVVAAVALGTVMLIIYCVRAEAPMRFYAWVDTKMGGVPGQACSLGGDRESIIESGCDQLWFTPTAVCPVERLGLP